MKLVCFKTNFSNCRILNAHAICSPDHLLFHRHHLTIVFLQLFMAAIFRVQIFVYLLHNRPNMPRYRAYHHHLTGCLLQEWGNTIFKIASNQLSLNGSVLHFLSKTCAKLRYGCRSGADFDTKLKELVTFICLITIHRVSTILIHVELMTWSLSLMENMKTKSKDRVDRCRKVILMEGNNVEMVAVRKY